MNNIISKNRVKIVLLGVLFQAFFFGYAGTNNDLRLASLEEIANYDFSGYTMESYALAFDTALELKNDHGHELNVARGKVFMRALAKRISNEIRLNNMDPNSRELSRLLKRFREQKYFIHQPEVSSTIKFFGYLCLGEYAHIYEIVVNHNVLWPLVIAGILFCGIVLFYFKRKAKQKHKKWFNRVLVTLLVLCVCFFVGFKATCECNVTEYAFYGIPIN